MQTELNHTVKSLFGKDSLDDMSREDLLLMTVKYPYSAIFQLLYTRKLQSLHDLRFPSSVAKTAIYFSNPHWLNHQLRAKTSVEALAEMEMAFENSHAVIAENEAPSFVQVNEGIEVNSHQELQEEVAPFHESSTDLAVKVIGLIAPPVASSTTFSTLFEEEVFSITNEEKQMEPVELTPEEFLTSPLEHAEEKIVLPEPLIDFPAALEEAESNSGEPAITEIGIEISDPETVKEESTPIMVEQINIVIPPEAKTELESMEIPLEPLYAVDYFASQGIRIREEDQQDQLGKKLKSFTEWLRSMKKVHPEKSKGQMDEKTEASIKSDAEQSNDKAEVLTETMAEVYIKQGLTQKALEVYEKLSLLDPVKSATFATKISELKAKER